MREDIDLRFAEAARKLKVRAISEPERGYGNRSYGAKVTDTADRELWLKVFGVRSVENARWQAEVEADAIVAVRKPKLVKQIIWKHQGNHWVARLSDLAGPIVESGPWAGVAAKAMTDDWLAELGRSLEILCRQHCTRDHVRREIFQRWLRRYVGGITPAPSDFVPSHNDLQWSNLACPSLSIVDWEWYGRSPRGYDQGSLITYSCQDEQLTTRLEQAFAPVLNERLGKCGALFAAHTIRNSIASGWLNPLLNTHVERLISRWETELRHNKS